MWARVVSTILGIWMMIVPSILEYGKSAANNAYIIGPVIITISFISMSESVRSVRWLNLFTGLWLVLAPFILPFQKVGIYNDVLVGIVVICLTFSKGRIKEKMGGGWIAIFSPDSEHERAAMKLKNSH